MGSAVVAVSILTLIFALTTKSEKTRLTGRGREAGQVPGTTAPV